MINKHVSVRILAPDHELWSGKCTSLSLVTDEGQITILPNHETSAYSLANGAILADGKKVADVTGPGTVCVRDNIILITIF